MFLLRLLGDHPYPKFSPSALILGDNLFYGNSLTKIFQKANNNLSGATLFAYPVNNPERFGVVKFNKKFSKISKNLTILRSFNMSIGVNLLKTLVSISSKNLSEISDIEILEFHHNKKRDVPSGTAITLFDSVNEGKSPSKKRVFRSQTADKIRSKNEVGFSSIRGGDVVGEHTVFFFMDGERIELTHKASDRKIFSIGALKAAKWLFKKKPGLYTILDMIS